MNTCPCCGRFLVWKMKEKWKCWYCDIGNSSAWKCSKHGSMSLSEGELSDLLGVKLEIEEMKEALVAKEAAAEQEFKTIAAEYDSVWASLIVHPSFKDLQNIKCSHLDRLSQPCGMAGSTSSQGYLDSLVASVRALMPKFQDLLYKLAQATGVRVLCVPIKSTKRISEKALFSYGKDLSKVLDIGRGSAIAADLPAVVAATNWVIQNCAVIRLKNRFCNVTHLQNRGGYRDILINIYLSGFILELQIHLKVFYDMKTQSTNVFNVTRTIERTLWKLDVMSKQQATEGLAARLRALTDSDNYSFLQTPTNAKVVEPVGTLAENAVMTFSLPTPQSDEAKKNHFDFESKSFPLSESLERILSLCPTGLQYLDPKPCYNEWQEFVVYAKAHSHRTECLYGLGYCLRYGFGVSQQEHEAVRILRLAAVKNSAPAQECLGRCYEEGKGMRASNPAEAVRLYHLAAEQNYVDAQVALGLCYENAIGVMRDNAEAFRWYSLAAKQKDARAQFRLALCYERGLGTAQDEQEGIKYALLAANQDFSDAQHYLGCCNEVGIGLSVNASEAVKWYRRAADQNNPDGQCCLGVCYGQGVGVSVDLGEAVKWYRLAADQNSGEGNYYLGCCYRDGTGVPKDVNEAKRLFCLAIEQDYDNARFALEEMESEGNLHNADG